MADPSVKRRVRHSSRIAPRGGFMSGDGRQNSVRELARRFLRSRGVIVRHPSEWNEANEDFSVKLSDIAPAVYLGIEFKQTDKKEIRIDLIGEKGGILSKNLPESIEIVWIYDYDGEAWKLLRNEIFELAKAGYPGCLSCGGDVEDGVWNEELARQKMNV